MTPGRSAALALLIALPLAAGGARAEAGDASRTADRQPAGQESATTAAAPQEDTVELEHALDRIRSTPRDASGFADLATWLFRRGDLSRARAAAAEAARLEPESAATLRLLGYLSAAAGAPQEAEEALAHAARIDPSSRASLADFHLARAWAGYQEALRRSGPDAAVLERLREIAAATEISPELKSMLRGGWPEEAPAARESGPPIHLGEGVDTAIVVEKRTQTVRLYGRVANGVGLLKTYPCTTGQAEGAKQERGDLKTPDGVYFFSDLLAGERLPNLYGVLALPLSYPNAWDRRAGRSGHGIWFHGSDRLTSPFTPRDTQGCVLMRNEDLLELAGLVQPLITPVLIAEEVPDRPAAEWQAVVHALDRRGAAAPPAAIVAGPEYTVLVRTEAGAVSYDFVASGGETRFLLQESAAAPRAEDWDEKLRRLQPEVIGSLRDVRVDAAAGRVVIDLSAPTRPLVFRAELAQRLYLDLRGVRSAPAPEIYSGGGLVRRVRATSVGVEPPLTRVVIDVARDATCRVESEGERIVVTVVPDSRGAARRSSADGGDTGDRRASREHGCRGRTC